MRTNDDASLVEQIAERCSTRGLTVAAVESLTSGTLSGTLGKGAGASEWFRGTVVAYHLDTKHAVLGLPAGTDPSTTECAAHLAESGRALLGSDVCVSVTGVGGPEPDGAHPAGEVHLGVATPTGVETFSFVFDGAPAEVIAQSVHAALRALGDALDAYPGSDSAAAPTPSAGVRIERIAPSDAGEVLTIQRAAFVSEAQIYGSAESGPLTQTLEQLEAEIADGLGWVARRHGRLVGAMRYREADDRLLVGRIAIAPDVQGEGIGRKLLAAAEEHSGAAEAELFTGSLSEANLRLYESCGYREVERVDQGDGTAQVFLRKRLR